MRRSIHAVLFVAAGAALAGAPVQTPSVPVPFTVHEWGTFTSIAGADGMAVQWLPQAGPPDLPCFVERGGITLKIELSGTVRMETPVLYFYAARPVTASVDVRFNRGRITEWYPHATVTSDNASLATGGGRIWWPSVDAAPAASDAFPRESGASHYYAARETGATPLRVGAQAEKFLFYRGVGQFQPPINAVTQPDGGVALRNLQGAPLGDVLVFENRRGAMTFTVHHLAGAEAVLPRPPLDDASGPPLAELRRMLVAHGLYEREAQAMVDTWRDSWFEEGARLLYIVPRVDVDAILPLTIEPKPSAVARVFVGRMELVTPATIRDVTSAVASNDRATLDKYGRFLEPIAARAGIAAPSAPPPVPQPACRP
jgi:hypothetical protein